MAICRALADRGHAGWSIVGSGSAPVLMGYGFLLLGIGLLRWRRPDLFERFVYLVAAVAVAAVRAVPVPVAGVDGHRRPQPHPRRGAVPPDAASRSSRRGRWIGCGCGCCPGRRSRTGPRCRTGCARPSAPRTAGSASSPGRPHELELWFLTADPLVEPVAPDAGRPGPVNLDALPVGRCEDGSVYRLPLRGNHVLCVGETGAGKGSVLWSIIDQLAPAVRAGMVELWALDPKGGMELAVRRDRCSPGSCTAREGDFADHPGSRGRGDATPPADPARRHPAARTLHG